MANLRAQDRLQPALLDRLTDDEPEGRVEALESRVINRTRLRELVLRDLAWLFNTTQPGEWLSGNATPHAARSVLGRAHGERYGVERSAQTALRSARGGAR